MGNLNTAKISETEGAFGGVLRRMRAAVGGASFGMQVVELPPNSGDAYPTHTHDEQEEIFIALRGSGEIVVGEERSPLDGDTIVRVAPGAPRQLRSGPDGMRVLALGGTPGQAYEPGAWTEFGGPDPSPRIT